MKKIFIILLSFSLFGGLKADEGMWMLPLIEKLNIQKANGMGCTLTADEIYSNNNISLKDAVVVFGSGCTGVVVSDKGLVFTNHHCGFGAIQQHSTVEHNYLKDGFTADKLEDEIPTPGLTVKFLVKIEDVTERILSTLTEELSIEARNKKQDSVVSVIKKEFEKGTHYRVQVKSFYSDNEFYVFVFLEFTDIRFAYAPPSSIGKFGGDTDNWMWPRHTGDFSVFRVYSSPDGKPAKYSKDNVPYSSKKFAVVSTQGYQAGDFAMIMGNPGSTSRYLSSWGIENRMKAINQARINVRGAKQEVWRSYMSANEAINIAYSSKYNRSSNYWKNSIGMNQAILKLNTLEQKRKEEKAFSEWVNQSEERISKYGKVLQNLEDGYTTIYPYSKAINFLRESLYAGVEMPRIASRIRDLSKKNLLVDSLLKTTESFYKDYYPQVDEATFAAMLNEYKKSVDADALPDFYNVIQKKFKGDFEKYAKYVYTKSSFTSFEKLSKAIRSNKVNYKTDPALIWWDEVSRTMKDIHAMNINMVTKKCDAERCMRSFKEISAKSKPRYPIKLYHTFNVWHLLMIQTCECYTYNITARKKHSWRETEIGFDVRRIKNNCNKNFEHMLKTPANARCIFDQHDITG
jgi:hypothetical protein